MLFQALSFTPPIIELEQVNLNVGHHDPSTAFKPTVDGVISDGPQLTESKISKFKRGRWRVFKINDFINKLKIKQQVATRRSVRLYQRRQLKFGKLSVDLQSKIGWEVLKNLKLNEQLKLRAISPAWDYNVQLGYKQVSSLVLHLPFSSDKKVVKKGKVAMKSTKVAKSALSICDKFKRNIDENLKQPTQINKVELKIRAQQWEHSTNVSLGKMFSNIDQLTIYYTMNNHNIKLLCDLLQKFPKVTSFSLIILNQILKCNEHFISQLFSAINSHLAPLSSLHVYFESRFTPTIDPNSLDKTLSFVQNLSLCFPFENYHEIIAMIGKNESSRFPIQSCSLRVPISKQYFTKFQTSKLESMLKQNSALSRVKRLQLVDVVDRKKIDSLLNHFTGLEYLEISIGSKLVKTNQYSVEWMETLSKLTHLTELVLHGMHPKTLYSDIEKPVTPLSTVRRLTVDYSLPWENIYQDWEAENGTLQRTNEQLCLIIIDFLVSFARQYPNLEELTMYQPYKDDAESRKELFKYFPNLKTVQFKYF